MNYEPHCVMTWANQCAGADDQSRTVEQVMSELNEALATLTEIESIPVPHSELIQMRRRTAEWIAHRALVEAQAIQDMRAVVARAKEPT